MVILFAYFFYRSVAAAFLLTPVIYFYKKDKGEKIIRKKKENMELEFKELLLNVRTNLQAGYSIENCFLESRKDMVRLHGENGLMVKELDYLQKGISNGITFERMILQIGKRNSGEIKEFCNIFLLASKMGGRWNEIIENTVEIITKKIELKEEIKLLIYEKELEHKIMCIIPFFIMTYMEITSGGYFQVLYHNPLGIFLMTGAMILYIFAYKLGDKITQLKR